MQESQGSQPRSESYRDLAERVARLERAVQRLAGRVAVLSRRLKVSRWESEESDE